MRPSLRLSLRPDLRRGSRAGRVAAALALVIALAGCSGSSAGSGVSGVSGASDGASGSGSHAIPVLGTENFYGDLLAEIGGPHVSAASILNDPNADPHAFESSPQDAKLVADARLVIVNGVGYDDFMQKLLGASPDSTRVVIDVQQLRGLGNDVNAHIWYDPATMPALASAVVTALSKLDPTNAADYAVREQAYLASLAPIAAEIATLKSKYAGTPVAFTEPVAGYLATAIGLMVLTPEGFEKAVEDGTDPAPSDVAAERDLLTGRQVKVLLYNSQVTSPITDDIHDLAVANGIPVVGVAETIPAGFTTFEAWQLAQLKALGTALAGGG